MVRSLVALHGGTVKAESGGSGRGAEVTIDLPLTEAVARTNASPAAITPPRTLSVLVIEDNQDTLELLQTWLQMLGHSVQGASDGRAGLQLAISMKPDLAFVDIGLPELDGIEVAKHLRASDVGRSIQLVAVTGYGRPEDRARALDAGFDDYIVKPLNPSALDRVLSRVASGRDGARSEDGAVAEKAAAPPPSPRPAEQPSGGDSSRSGPPQ
jgi:CheY-like chemotaxis protein